MRRRRTPAARATPTERRQQQRHNNGLFSAQPAVSSTGTLTYTPAANANGSATVSVQIHDNGGTANGGVDTSAAQTFTITVNAVNDAPVLDLNGGGAGIDTSATFTEGDPPVTLAPSLVLSDVDSANMSAAAITLRTQPGGTVPIDGSAEALNGDKLGACAFQTTFSYNSVTGVLTIIGSASIASYQACLRTITYENTSQNPSTNTRTADFQVFDSSGLGNSPVPVVTITVNAVNDAPVAANDSYSTNEDTNLSTTAATGVLNNDTDVDTAHASLTAALVAGPSHAASFTLNADGSFSYTPAANYNGSDSFTYKANDGSSNSNIATVSLTVNAVNDAPVCSNVSLTTDEDTPGDVAPNCTDVDGDTLTYSIVSGASHGTASVVSGQLHYSPAANYNGSDSFTYKANDGLLDSNTATVNVTVNAVNDAPVCSNVSLTTDEDTPGDVAPSCTDVDGDTLTYSIVSGASHGTASVVSGQLHYSPAANYNGSDSFTYKANDGLLDSNTATVNVTVNAVNDAPVCSNVSLTTDEDTPGDVAPNCTDVDGDTLTYSIVSGASHGTASVVSGQLHYSPAANYNGSDSFTYKANDGLLDSNTATVSVTVNAVNDAPVVTLTGPTGHVAEGSSFHFTYTTTDPDTGETFSDTITGCPGSVTNDVIDATTGDGSFDCTFPDGPSTHTVKVTVSDGELTGSDQASVTVDNVAPTATFTASSPIDEGSSSTLSFTGASDPSAADTIAGFHYSFACDGLTASLASTYASAGTSSTTTCSFADNGSYTVKGRIFDRDEGSTDYSATVVVNNVAPTVVAPADQSSNEGTSKSFDLGSFSDPGVNDNPWAVDVNWGDASADTTFDMGTQGTIDAQSHTYADGPNDYTVTVKVTDKDGDSDSKTFSVHVNNVAPTATFTASSPIDEGSSSTLSFTGASDPSAADTIAGFHYSFACDGLTASLASTYASAGTSTTTTCPFADNGSYTVKGRIFDRDEGSTDYSATVVVNNVAPTVVAPADQSSNEGTAKSFDLGSFSDPGVNDNPWAVDVNWGDASAHTTFDMGTQGTIDAQSHTYADGPNDYTVTVKVTDKDGDSDSKTFSVHVNNVAPTATFTASSPIDEGSSSTLSFTGASDPSAADTIAGFHYSFACDGLTASLASTYASAGTSATTTCPFADNGSYTVKGRIFDRDEGSTDYSATVVVNNVAPTVVAPADQSSNEGTAKSFDLGSFSDPGVNDNPWAVDVNWGDASAHTTFDMGTQGTIDAQSHTYADGPNDYTVTVKVTDKDGDSDSKTFSVHVNNVAPTATFTASSPIDEGSSSTLSFTAPSDPSSADTTAGFHYSFACDGLTASLASTYASAGTTSSTTCPFADNGSYTVKGRIFDRDEGSTDYSATVVVNNVAPTVVAPADQSSNEGTAKSFDLGSFSDPGVNDNPWAVDVNWGDASATPTSTWGPRARSMPSPTPTPTARTTTRSPSRSPTRTATPTRRPSRST